MFDDGRGQRRALHRIRSAPQFVKEDEGIRVGLLQHPDDVAHMGGEGGQGLGDGLLVPDVRQDPVEDPDGAAVGGGDVQTALSHQREKPDGLQGHGLAAGVGAGDDQGIEAVPQGQVVGHSGLLVQQGMPGVPEADEASGRDPQLEKAIELARGH